MDLKEDVPAKKPWRQESEHRSLPEAHGTIALPDKKFKLKRLLAFIGPGYLIAVGYMDPGNWATDLAGGSKYNYALLSIVLFSGLAAIFLQALSAKLGLVTGRDLAQACRDAYPKPVTIFLWISAEIAIAACDLAEVIGSAIALNLLFHVPLLIGVIVTAADVLVVLGLQHRGFRLIEAIVMVLIGSMIAIFAYEVFLSKPEWSAVAKGFIPTSKIVADPEMLFISLGILGATVMPHNLYLHSSIVQTRKIGKTAADIKEAIRNVYIDSTAALTIATIVNAAILIVAAAAFYRSGNTKVEEIQQAYKLLSPIVGVGLAAPLFAVALLASGQNSTLTGTLAGQIILEGFLSVRMTPWKRRMVSRLIAIVPAIVAVGYYGEAGLQDLMLWSQVILSAQLSFAVFPLIQFTSDKHKMGGFVNRFWTQAIGWTTAAIILVLNVYLIFKQVVPASPLKG